MQILKINPKYPDQAMIWQAVKVLKDGGVVVFPTDTAYGLGGDIFNREAVKRLFKIKGRPMARPLSVMAASIKMAQKISKLDRQAESFFKKYLPGALTIILPKKKCVSNLVTAGRLGVGIRIPDNKISLALTKKLKGPISCTSANISGQPPQYSAQKIYKIFKKRKFQPDLILDAGVLQKVKPSTIIDLSGKRCKIIRNGPVRVMNLEL